MSVYAYKCVCTHTIHHVYKNKYTVSRSYLSVIWLPVSLYDCFYLSQEYLGHILHYPTDEL